MATATKTKQRQQLTEGQLRKVIREEMSKMEGISEMSKEEKTELEEGIWDRMKANFAGAKAGAGASVSNIAGNIKGRYNAATSAYGDPNALAGHTEKDAAAVKAFTKAEALLDNSMAKVNAMKIDFERDLEKMNFGQFDGAIKPEIKAISASLVRSVDLVRAFFAKVKAAKETGQWKGVRGVAGPQNDSMAAQQPVAPSAQAGPDSVSTHAAIAAESVARNVTKRLNEMNKKSKRTPAAR